MDGTSGSLGLGEKKVEAFLGVADQVVDLIGCRRARLPGRHAIDGELLVILGEPNRGSIAALFGATDLLDLEAHGVQTETRQSPQCDRSKRRLRLDGLLRNIDPEIEPNVLYVDRAVARRAQCLGRLSLHTGVEGQDETQAQQEAFGQWTARHWESAPFPLLFQLSNLFERMFGRHRREGRDQLCMISTANGAPWQLRFGKRVSTPLDRRCWCLER